MRTLMFTGIALQPSLVHAHVTAGSGAATPVAWALALIAASALGYGIGLRRIWCAAGPGRGIGVPSAAAFGSGLLLLALLLSDRVEAVTARSFAAHMIQHELMMLVAAPLLVLGRPLAAWSWTLPARVRAPAARALARPTWRQAWTAFTSPAGATLVQLLALFAWHLPRAFDAAIADPWLHALQHASFLGAALAFSWMLFSPRNTGRPAPVVAGLFVTMLLTGMLGALLAFSAHPWYAAYRGHAEALADQQVGGLVMWLPGGTFYLVAALWWCNHWLRRQPPAAPVAARLRA